jgi:hypothetical protein
MDIKQNGKEALAIARDLQLTLLQLRALNTAIIEKTDGFVFPGQPDVIAEFGDLTRLLELEGVIIENARARAESVEVSCLAFDA